MNDTVDTTADPFAEPPEVQERNIWLGVRVMAGVTIMFFLSFVFAYFYLRSLNNGGRWRPAGIDPPQTYGYVIIILFVAERRLCSPHANRAARRARTWLPVAGLALRSVSRPASSRDSSRRTSGSLPPRAATRASSSAGRSCSRSSRCSRSTGSRSSFATGLRHRRAREAYVPQGLDAASFYWTLLVVIGAVTWVILYLL